MFVLGVTGGIGSGKSTVARMLGDRGARVLDADAIVRELYAGDLARAVEERFGPGMLAPDGSVDRTRLGQVVFASEEERKALEALVHPAVRERVLGRLDQWRREGWSGIVVIDAALLVEVSSPYPLDALLVVTAAEDVRVRRLAERGVSAEEARRRMAAQLEDDEKLRRADLRIANDGTREELEGEVERVLRELARDERAQSE